MLVVYVKSQVKSLNLSLSTEQSMWAEITIILVIEKYKRFEIIGECSCSRAVAPHDHAPHQGMKYYEICMRKNWHWIFEDAIILVERKENSDGQVLADSLLGWL